MRKKIKLKLLSLVVVLGTMLLTLSGCTGNTDSSHQHDQISIVTTTNIYADIAQNIVGKYGKAEPIIDKASMDPHDFEPKTNDAKKLSNADLVVANGLGYDSWMNKLASSVDKKPILVGEDVMGLAKNANPHIWYSLTMPTKYVNYLVKKLSKKDPKHRDYYQANADKYLAKITKVKKLADKIDGTKHKPVYVSEPVFDYALQASGLKVANQDFEKAIENETDPSPATIQKMTTGIKEHKIAFFVNNTQATSPVVNNFVKQAKKSNVPVLEVRETIPDKTTYLEWLTDNYQKLAKIVQK
ncbi:zinc ABC transporter substrate-binding protein [Lactobacillus sp. ESL0681]|uniref:metal ABC transporter solute-binding protein, Zn/Mn family n=1 Tax=Lactobacillus sp. ESL0681 TaxID=2983211 RepID=UPI0023F6CECF|nr:zinc ABC transporter substrate-binding protein [Lactobacillus sp. ESL0681]WEV39523.1 zinc ABC transporter substrate-binding protein [Lactobacillus sp. ESL0681]